MRGYVRPVAPGSPGVRPQREDVDSIESIILAHDRRGIAAVRDVLGPAYCLEAAAYLRDHLGTVLILTGFYVAGAAETDGPIGALALAGAVAALGGTPVLVSDRYGAPLLRRVAPDLAVEEFPIADAAVSEAEAAALLARRHPSLALAIERCGATASGRYLNMRGADISAHTARLDPLLRALPSIAIGDGGNELGMGTIADALSARLGLPDPCRTAADRLVIAAVSNWGAYGLLTALSQLTGRPLLPSAASQHALLLALVEAGAVSGVTERREAAVDGLPAHYHTEILGRLQAYLARTSGEERAGGASSGNLS